MTDTTLQAFVAASSLPAEDKSIWEKAFTLLNAAQTQVLGDVVEEDETKLKMLTENLKEKHEAFKNNDSDALQAVFDKEATQLESQVTE